MAQISATEIVILGGLDATGRPLKDVHIFDEQANEIREISCTDEEESAHRSSLVPHNFPCLRIQENIVVTIDLHTRKVIEYNHATGKVKPVATISC